MLHKIHKMSRRISTKSAAALLLSLLLTSTLLQLTEATNNKNRFDALTAGSSTKARKGSGGKIKDAQGADTAKTRSKRFGECFNKLNENIGVARRSEDRPEKAREKKAKFSNAADSCADLTSYACSSGGNSGGSGDTNTSTNTNSSTGGGNGNGNGGGNRRLMEMVMGINVREMSIDEARARMRDILAQAEEEDVFERITFDDNDEDQNDVGERIVATMGEESLANLCTAAEDEDMGTMLRNAAGKRGQQKEAADASLKTMSSGPSLLPYVARKSLAEQLALLREVKARASDQSLKAKSASFATAQTATCGNRGTGIKGTTAGELSCDANGLANGVKPAYIEGNSRSFPSAVSSLVTFDFIPNPDDQGGFYKEYSDADKWADNFLTKAAFETTLNALNEGLDAATSACDIQEAFATWAGVGGGVALTPSKVWCGAIGLGLKIAILVAEIAFVSTTQYIDEAVTAHDIAIQGVEVESTAENVLSVIHNQAVSFTEIGNKAQAVIAKVKESENNTKAVVLASAGDTVKAIIAVGDKVDEGFRDLRLRITQLETLLNQRACENANQLTAVHITVNHIQRMLQMPEGLRPGFVRNGDLGPCLQSNPLQGACTRANGTRSFTLAQICTANPIVPTSGLLPASSGLVTAATALEAVDTATVLP